MTSPLCSDHRKIWIEGIFDPIAVTCCYYTLARAPLAKCSEGFWCVFLVAEGHSSTALSPSKRLRNKIGLLAKRGAKRIETHYITIEPPKKNWPKNWTQASDRIATWLHLDPILDPIIPEEAARGVFGAACRTVFLEWTSLAKDHNKWTWTKSAIVWNRLKSHWKFQRWFRQFPAMRMRNQQPPTVFLKRFMWEWEWIKILQPYGMGWP